MQRRFEGRSVLITGATAGIGLATACRFADEGAVLTLAARGRDRGEALVRELGPDGAQFLAVDLCEPLAAQTLVDAAVEQFGALDVLVNNAGMDFTSDLLQTEDADVRRVFELNFFAAWRTLATAANSMRERGGAIVNVTSRLASIGVPTMAIYGAAKGALLSLTRGAAVELAPIGIRVNAVAPGLTETPLVIEWLAGQLDPNAAELEAKSTIPQRRFARPQEVAAAIAYLAADESAHVTGVSLPVDGGYTAA